LDGADSFDLPAIASSDGADSIEGLDELWTSSVGLSAVNKDKVSFEFFQHILRQSLVLNILNKNT